MKLLFYLEKDKYSKVNDLLLKNDLLARQSINFREASTLGSKDLGGYFLELDCSEEAVPVAKETLKDFAKEITGADKEKILKIIQEQEEAANAGFGSIFG